MHAEWHFWYAVGFCGESSLRKGGWGGINPLGGSYELFGLIERAYSPFRILSFEFMCFL
ncbi:DUF3265 domain-containing protein [Vibrio mimicus]